MWTTAKPARSGCIWRPTWRGAPWGAADGPAFARTQYRGRLLLIVPMLAPQPTLGRQIAVAWNASRPAARALSDALPLIEQAERTVALTIDAERQQPAEARHAGCILDHLRRHCRVVHARTLQVRNHAAIADMLQTAALAKGADLLVAGACGHPKLWEKMLGGVTRDLLAHMRLPVRMSH